MADGMQTSPAKRLTKLVLKPTLYCFHKCKYCDLRQFYFDGILAQSKPGSHMPLEMAFQQLEGAYALGMTECLLSGGDPLLYPHLVELITKIRSYTGVFAYMNSVGTRLTRERAAAILGAGLQAWNVSIDSPDPAVHDKGRGIPGAFKASMAAIDILRELRSETPAFKDFRINFQCVLTRHNYRDLPALFALAKEKEIASIYLMNVYGDEGDNFLMRREDIEAFRGEVVPEILGLLNSGSGEIVVDNAKHVLGSYFETADNSIENYERGIYWNDLETAKRRCDIPDYYALIEPDGAVLPCCQVEISHEGVAGNVSEKALAEVWEGSGYENFRRDKIDYCLRCPVQRHKTIGLVPEMCRQFKY